MYYKFNQDSLIFEKINISSKILIGVGIVLGCIVATGFTLINTSQIDKLSQEEKLIIINQYNEFTEEKFIKEVKDLNFKFPYIVIAQSIQETGRFKSKIFLENSNLFGMKQARQRVNLAKGTERGHAYYNTWQESLYDYALYYGVYLNKIRTEEEYFEYLSQYYAEDPNYVENLKQLIKKHNLKQYFNN